MTCNTGTPQHAGMMQLADMLRLERRFCRFESCYPHHTNILRESEKDETGS